MTRRLPRLAANDSGAAAIQFALAAPVLISFIWGLFQVSLVLQANAGVQHALGQGARMATITATTDLFCSGLTCWDFRPVVEANGGLGWKLLQRMAKMLRDERNSSRS